MSCYSDYITISDASSSRSGLTANSLPGIEINLIESLKPSDQATYLEFWNKLYDRAWQNLVSDVTDQLNEKFFVDLKLVSRETSEFQSTLNSGSSLAGVQIKFNLPKYARLHVINVEFFSAQDYDSPDVEIKFFEENESGNLLHTASGDVTEGRSKINVDTDFEVDSLFVGYDPSAFSFRKTENKYYSSSWIKWDKLECMFPCQFGEGSVKQINGGGLNVSYVIYCSIEKFVCLNINLFKQAFLWRIGNEIIIERRYGNTVNCFTAMTAERAEELTEFYLKTYSTKLHNSIKGHNVNEDPFCFNCKNPVTVKTVLP